MKRAAVALRRLATGTVAAIGIEGAFLLAGTALVAWAASYVSPAGPPLVIGGMCILAGIALALPARKE